MTLSRRPKRCMSRPMERFWYPRVIENKGFDSETELNSDNFQPRLAPLHQSDRPLKLELGGTGGINSIRWVNDDEAESELGAEEVEIKTSAVSFG